MIHLFPPPFLDAAALALAALVFYALSLAALIALALALATAFAAATLYALTLAALTFVALVAGFAAGAYFCDLEFPPYYATELFELPLANAAALG